MKHRAMAAVLVTAVALGAAPDSTSRLDAIEQRVNAALSKAGIHFGGSFRSHFLSSVLDTTGAVVDNNRRSTEDVQYTSVDFDINARPTEAVGGRVLFRMHQDWRNFFSDISNPIFSRWISIDGTFRQVLSYSAGDFRQRYSPLTLWSPDIDIPFEPLLFARQRREAQGEVFVGNNDRLLQGLNLDFDAEIFPLLARLHLNAQGSRLRMAQTSIQNGSAVAASIEAAPMDKYLLGLNLEAVAVPGLSLGASLLRVFDVAQSFRGPPATADTMAQASTVMAGRLALGTPLFTATQAPVRATLSGEFAHSRDDSLFYAVHSDSALNKQVIAGSALRTGFSLAATVPSAAGVTLNIDYLRNDADFRNEMAQSPSFIGDRIMNIENDVAHPDRPLYTTTDALYRHVFKFTPSQAAASARADWIKMPMRKLSYTSTIFTQQELRGIVAPLMDPSVQLLMPFGPATPNRSGITADLAATLENHGLKAGFSLSLLGEVVGDSVTTATLHTAGSVLGTDTLAADTLVYGGRARMATTSFVGAGGGFSLDLAKVLAPLQGPLVLSAGYRHAGCHNPGTDDGTTASWSIATGFLNAGLHWNVWKRFWLLGGMQHITVTTTPWSPAPGLEAEAVREQTLRWSAGAEYTVGEGGTLTGLLGSTNWSSDQGDDQYFTQWQFELHLSVDF